MTDIFAGLWQGVRVLVTIFRPNLPDEFPLVSLLLIYRYLFTYLSLMIKVPTLLTWFLHDLLDFDVTADISCLQDVGNRKVLSTSCVIAIR